MRSGDLRHRIEWQVQTRKPDGGGGFAITWIPVPGIDATMPNAAIWDIKGEKQFEGGRTVAIATKRIRIRYRRGFSAAWRGKDLCHFFGQYLQIVTTPMDIGDKHQWLECMVKEVEG